MKNELRDLLLLIVVIAIGYLIYQQRKSLQGVTMSTEGIQGVDDGILKFEPVRDSFTQTFTIADEPKRLPYGKTLSSILISTPAGNAGSIYIANSYAGCLDNSRFAVDPGDSMPFYADELSELYYYGTLNDTFSLLCEVEGRK